MAAETSQVLQLAVHLFPYFRPNPATYIYSSGRRRPYIFVSLQVTLFTSIPLHCFLRLLRMAAETSQVQREEWLIEIITNKKETESGPQIKKVATILPNMESNKECFVPSVVSLGPLHYGCLQFSQMELYKKATAHWFISLAKKKKRGEDITADEAKSVYDGFVRKEEISESLFRGFYGDELVNRFKIPYLKKMMFLDGCFILHFIHLVENESKDDDLSKKGVQLNRPLIIRDMFLLENQIPYLVLTALMSLMPKPPKEEGTTTTNFDEVTITNFISKRFLPPYETCFDAFYFVMGLFFYFFMGLFFLLLCLPIVCGVLLYEEFKQPYQAVQPPSDQDNDGSGKQPEEDATQIAANQALQLPADQAVQPPSDQANDGSGKQPKEDAIQIPANQAIQLPADQAVQPPSDQANDGSGKQPKEDAIQIPANQAVQLPVDQAVQPPSDQANDGSGKQPVKTPLHLLDLLRSELIGEEAPSPSQEIGYWNYCSRPIRELNAIGIQVKSSKNGTLKDNVKFNPGFIISDLELPQIIVDDSTKTRMLNLVAYEMCLDAPSDCQITSYICFLDSLIHDARDVKELRSKNILLNRLGKDKDVTKLFKEMTTNLSPDYRIYREVMKGIDNHKDRPPKHVRLWIGQLIQTYFTSPWTLISLIAAISLIVLTLLQTIYSILSYRKGSS